MRYLSLFRAILRNLAIVAVLFGVSIANAAAQTENILYRFQGGEDGAGPVTGLVSDAYGDLYGTTGYGGGSAACLDITTVVGCGVVFELVPNANGTRGETVLYAFQGGSDGAHPYSTLVVDASGNLYGTTTEGGNSLCNGVGCGTVFRLTPPSSSGGAWTESILYRFLGTNDGSGPRGGVVFDSTGNLYGTTQDGGSGANCTFAGGCGTLFELSPQGDGAWKETVLHVFSGTAGGQYPLSGLVFDAHQNLYGTTYIGGLGPDMGTVFRASVLGSNWDVTVLHSFQQGPDGSYPFTGVVLDGKGNVYGTTQYGGGGRCLINSTGGCGSVFELAQPSNAGGVWNETRIATFPDGREGRSPEGDLAFDENGNLYGTTALGGNGFWGDVFELVPPAFSGGMWSRRVLYYFQGGSDGFDPQGSLLWLNGSVYGTTQIGGEKTCSLLGGEGCGTVYKISP